MPIRKSLDIYLRDLLIAGGWRGVEVDEDTGALVCPKGTILQKDNKGNLQLKFFSYSGQPLQYYEREKYHTVIFPEAFDIRKYLYFRNNGNYKLSNEPQFKKIINALGKDLEQIKITESGNNFRRFYGAKLVISEDVFVASMGEAENIRKLKGSYAATLENYLANNAAQKFSKDFKKRTTYINKGEFLFLVNRLNLGTKKSQKDFQKYLEADDITSIESLTERLVKFDMFSDEFLRKLNDYFVKEQLRDIIKKGRHILALGSTNLSTKNAVAVQKELGLVDIKQLENLWQKYFERYLLYLIFTYKKIFPKVELEDIDSDKKYPDFIGVNHYNGLDVIEIKTHLKNLLSWDDSHKNFYFSPETSKAIVQTSNYLDAIIQERFKQGADKNKITNYTDEENLYHPRGIIVISSSTRLTTKSGEDEKLKRDFTKLRNSLNNIQILTFDEIINIADEYIKNIVEDDD